MSSRIGIVYNGLNSISCLQVDAASLITMGTSCSTCTASLKDGSRIIGPSGVVSHPMTWNDPSRLMI